MRDCPLVPVLMFDETNKTKNKMQNKINKSYARLSTSTDFNLGQKINKK